MNLSPILWGRFKYKHTFAEKVWLAKVQIEYVCMVGWSVCNLSESNVHCGLLSHLSETSLHSLQRYLRRWTYNDVSQRPMQWKTFILIIFIIFIFKRLRMYAARANTNCAYNGIVRILACEYKNGNKGYFFSICITFKCAVSNLMFNSGEFCDSSADGNRVKQKWQKSVFVSVSETNKQTNKNLKQSWLPAFWKRSKTHKRLKERFFNKTKEDKTCKFSR